MFWAALLYPLAIGSSWTYDVRSSYPSCPPGERTAVVAGKKAIDGRDAWEVKSFCGFSGYVAATGETVDSYYQGWWRYIDAPVEEGHTWQYFRSTATWHSLGSVTVKAGTFSDCWRLTQNVSYTATQDFCRGVGLVRTLTVDLAGGRIEAELKNFSLKGEL